MRDGRRAFESNGWSPLWRTSGTALERGGRMGDGRMRRVDEAVRAVLSDAIAKDLQDPRIGFVTVTGVKTSPDLRHARVYVSVLGDEPARARTLAGLRSAHGFLQGVIASELTLKRTPSLVFEYDETAERADRIHRLIDEQIGND